MRMVVGKVEEDELVAWRTRAVRLRAGTRRTGSAPAPPPETPAHRVRYIHVHISNVSVCLLDNEEAARYVDEEEGNPDAAAAHRINGVMVF
jgi:hypothetical protein